MIDPALATALNRHMNYEIYSAMIYFSMAGWLEYKGLAGCARWMHVQGQEEMLHAQKFYRFILDRDARIQLDGSEAPPQEWDHLLAVFTSSYEHECAVTQRINQLMDLSLKHSDHATSNFLQWFIQEQVEEEATARDIVDKLKLIGDDGSATLLIDQELGKRSLQVDAAQFGA